MGGAWANMGGAWVTVGGACVRVGGAWVSVGEAWASMGGAWASVGGALASVEPPPYLRTLACSNLLILYLKLKFFQSQKPLCLGVSAEID